MAANEDQRLVFKLLQPVRRRQDKLVIIVIIINIIDYLFFFTSIQQKAG